MSGSAPAPEPFAVYIHWPFCARLCPYCDFNIHLDRRGEAEALVAAIAADLATHARLTERAGPVTSVFFGGGTPSLMTGAQVGHLLQAVEAAFGLAEGAEVCLEANPDLADAGRYADFRAAGVERLSLGVQALDDAALARLGRTHTTARAVAAVELAARTFPRVSLDLIYARPGQTVAQWEAELTAALALPVGHISAYELTIEPGTAFGRQVARSRWAPPTEELRADLFEATHALTAAAGMPAYEVSNFARGEGQRSRHNLAYWRGARWVGVGPGAHGRLWQEGARVETVAHAGPAAYISAVGQAGHGHASTYRQNPAETRAEAVLMGLRPVDGMAALAHGGLTRRAEDLAAQGWLEVAGGRWQVAPHARALTDRIAAMLAEAAED